jgi:hypothetical protein
VTVILWGWAGLWLLARLWLEWQVDREWLPGTADVREDWTRWSTPPRGALTPRGERLWRLRHRLTLWGFLGWVALAVVWFMV